MTPAPETLLDSKVIASLIRLCAEALALPGDGEVWECGVYKGGSALALATPITVAWLRGYTIPKARLRLFDTFAGHPYDDPHSAGHYQWKYADTDLESVKQLFQLADFPLDVEFHPGVIPESFKGLEQSQIRFAHIDLDLYQSTKAAVEFIWPRLVPGGILVADDYFAEECGARRALDEYFTNIWGFIQPPQSGPHPQAFYRKK